MPHLLIMRKNSTPKQVDLSGERTLVGRDASNDVQIDHPQVSRHHAELRIEDETLWLIDLASRNGTVVNGRRVRQRPLRHGDVLRIGDCDLRVLMPRVSARIPEELALAD